MSKTYRGSYIPKHTSRKLYSGHGVKSVFNLGLGHDGSGYHGHANHRHLRNASSRMLRSKLKEETRLEVESYDGD